MIIDSLDCDQDIANLSDNVFCVAKETKDLADVIADYSIEKGYKNIGILHSTVDSFMPSVALFYKDRMGANASVQIESYVPGTSDFKTSLMKFANKEAIVFLGYDEIGLAMKQASDLNLNQPKLTIPTVATTPSIQQASKGSIEGIYFSFYFPLEENIVATKFYSDYNQAYGRTPIVSVATDQAYDSAKIVLEKVLPNVKGETKVERLQEKILAVKNIKDYSGVTGNLTMSEDGRIKGILIRLYQLQNLIPVFIQE